MFAILYIQSNVSISVVDNDKGLETCALANSRLFMDRSDFHDFVLPQWADNVVDDLNPLLLLVPSTATPVSRATVGSASKVTPKNATFNTRSVIRLGSYSA
ncbi:hypothetical protein V6N13_029327 [Hibiscus sabdariffa]